MSGCKILIKKFSWDNVRNFEQIEVPSGSNEFSESTSLVQIQNGYGKTTTLYLLRSIFTSKPIDKEFIKTGYRYRYPHNKWGGDQNKTSKFHVDFDIDGEFCRIGLEIDHMRGTQKFTTFSEKLGGEVDGWKPPHVFRRLFQGKDQFAKLFILDGELAKELNRGTGSAVVSNSINQVTNLSGLHLLVGSDSSDGQIHRVKHAYLSASLGNGGQREATLKGALSDVQSLITARRRALIDAKKLVSDKSEELISKNEELNEMDKKLEENNDYLEKAKAELERTSEALELISLDILGRLFKPAFSYPKWNEVKEFHSSQVKAKLPRSVGRTWFRELMELETCICGRGWDEHSEEYIKTHLEDYLDTRLMTYVKEMQDSVAEHKSSISLGSQIARLKSKQTAKVEAQQLVDDIRSQASEDDLAIFRQLNQDIGRMKTELNDYEFIRDELGSEILEFIRLHELDAHIYTNDSKITMSPTLFRNTINIHCLKIVEKEITAELAKVSGAASSAAGADLLLGVIREVLKTVEEEINIELETKMNSSLSRMVGAGLDGGLNVKITENGLQYYNPNGDLQSGVNMAAELGGTYAFISALYDYAEVSLPLVLDTPLAGFGAGMVAAWTRLIPVTFDQTIALINSGEKKLLEGWFVNDEIDCYLIRRNDEVINTGIPQEGKMILDTDSNNFINYESDVYNGSD